jgi:hypothetical protein
MENSLLTTEFEISLLLGKKSKLAKVMRLLEKATTTEIKENLPDGFSLADEKFLKACGNTFNFMEKYSKITIIGQISESWPMIIALGGNGPHPYKNHPGLTNDRRLTSCGEANNPEFKWGKNNLFLLMPNKSEDTTN